MKYHRIIIFCYRDILTKEATLPRRRVRADFANSRDPWSIIFEDSVPVWRTGANTSKTRRDVACFKIVRTNGPRRLVSLANGGPSSFWWPDHPCLPSISRKWWRSPRNSVTRSSWNNAASPGTSARKRWKWRGRLPHLAVRPGGDPSPPRSLLPPGRTVWRRVRRPLALYYLFTLCSQCLVLYALEHIKYYSC